MINIVEKRQHTPQQFHPTIPNKLSTIHNHPICWISKHIQQSRRIRFTSGTWRPWSWRSRWRDTATRSGRWNSPPTSRGPREKWLKNVGGWEWIVGWLGIDYDWLIGGELLYCWLFMLLLLKLMLLLMMNMFSLATRMCWMCICNLIITLRHSRTTLASASSDKTLRLWVSPLEVLAVCPDLLQMCGKFPGYPRWESIGSSTGSHCCH